MDYERLNVEVDVGCTVPQQGYANWRGYGIVGNMKRGVGKGAGKRRVIR